MIVKQYSVTLPTDYDMGIIRHRVATKGPSFDDFPGLGVKVFMIREKGRHGAEGNQYAPLYLWPSVEPMWGFVAGGGFKGILDSFGWTDIPYWLGLAFSRSEAVEWKALRSVTREQVIIEPGSDLADLRAREINNARETIAKTPECVARAVGVNTERWSLVRFDYWRCEQKALPAGSRSYEALHVSAPNPEQLKPT